MRQAVLQRVTTGDTGTFGTMSIDGDLFSHTLELPWRDNAPRLSCIPAGFYKCLWRESPSKGWCYEITDVDGRTHVLIHLGNWAGDVTMYLKSDVEGCVELGRAPAVMTPKPDKRTGFVYAPQLGITSSGPTVEAFNQVMAQETFMLEVRDIGAAA